MSTIVPFDQTGDSMKHMRAMTWLAALACTVCMQLQAAPSKPDPAAQALATSVHAHMEKLASDAMRGRGSATPDEVVAANYIAGELKRYGIQPAGDNGAYIQTGLLSPGAGPPGAKTTVNVVGMIKGSDPLRAGEVILLTA